MAEADLVGALLGQQPPGDLLGAWWAIESPLRWGAVRQLPPGVVGSYDDAGLVLRHPSAGIAARSANTVAAWRAVARSAGLPQTPSGLRLDHTNPLLGEFAPTTDPRPDRAWAALLDDACTLLAAHDHADAGLCGTVTTVVVPLAQRDGRLVGRPEHEVESGSLSSAIGAVFLSPGAWDPTMLAEALMHESYHQLFNAALSVETFTADQSARMASPWKPEPRPPDALLHGIVAFAAVRRFWTAESAAGVDDRGEISRRGQQVTAACDTVLASGTLTESGISLAEEARALAVA